MVFCNKAIHPWNIFITTTFFLQVSCIEQTSWTKFLIINGAFMGMGDSMVNSTSSIILYLFNFINIFLPCFSCIKALEYFFLLYFFSYFIFSVFNYILYMNNIYIFIYIISQFFKKNSCLALLLNLIV